MSVPIEDIAFAGDSLKPSLKDLNSIFIATTLPAATAEITRWNAIAAVESFYSWTEHLFIHLAILQGKIGSGRAAANLIGADWKDKFRAVFDLTESDSKKFHDELIELRREVRNFVAHGAFGKNGEAFQFHSGAGAVPVQQKVNKGKPTFTVTDTLVMDDARAVGLTKAFVEHMWSGPLAPAKIYLEEASLQTIVTYGLDGTYNNAMQSSESMMELVEYLIHISDRAADMDW